MSAGDGLEVQVVGGGGAAAGAVIERGESSERACQLDEVGEASAADGLRSVGALYDGVMPAKDGERVDEEEVAASEAGQGGLLRRAVGVAEEAGARAKGGGVGAGTGGNDAGGIELHVDAEAVEGDGVRADVL